MLEYKVDLRHGKKTYGVPVFFTKDEHAALESPRMEAILRAEDLLAETFSNGKIDTYNKIKLELELDRVTLVKGLV